jgi:prepilin-type N-terminal cleavage/methylation domain-containing protein
VKNKFSIPNRRPQFELRRAPAFSENGFTLVEVMVVVALLSLIVLALMAVFNSTQRAFRASITQADVLEGGRAAMDLMAEDLREMSPSLQNNAVNFYAANASGYPLVQSFLTGGQRTNVLEKFFILKRQNQTWSGVGYAVYVSPTNLYSLYRFSMSTNAGASSPLALYNIFTNDVYFGAWTNMSHLMDGVVQLTVRAYDLQGIWMTNGYASPTNATLQNVQFYAPAFGEVGFCMTNNALPASAEIEMGVLEDRTLQRAASLSGSAPAQSNYLAAAAAQVHLFRQRVPVPNVDPSV